MADEVARVEVVHGRAGAVDPGGRRPARAPVRWWWPPAAGRAISTACPSVRAPRCDRSGASPSACRPLRDRRDCAARCGRSSMGGPATWCPATTVGWWSGRPWRSGDTTIRSPSAGSVDLLDDARRDRPRPGRVRIGRDCLRAPTGIARQRPSGRVPRTIEGLVVATGHFRNGILLAPLTADEVVGLLTGETTGPVPGLRRVPARPLRRPPRSSSATGHD